MITTETTCTPESSSRHGMPFAGWLAILLLVLYPLSTGPAVKLAEHDIVSMDILEYVYAPLIWLAENCPPVADFFEWYLVDVWNWSIFK
jgi:hypothetical protein